MIRLMIILETEKLFIVSIYIISKKRSYQLLINSMELYNQYSNSQRLNKDYSRILNESNHKKRKKMEKSDDLILQNFIHTFIFSLFQ